MKHIFAFLAAIVCVVGGIGAMMFVLTNPTAREIAPFVGFVALVVLLALSITGWAYKILFGDDGSYE